MAESDVSNNVLTAYETISYDGTQWLYIDGDGPLTNYILNMLQNNTHVQFYTISEFTNMDDEFLPNNIKHLKLGSVFNKMLNFLPRSLENLTVGEAFNQPLNNLPHTIDTLTLACNNFTNSLNNLPCELKHLNLTYCTNFNQNLDYLPSSLEYLSLPKGYTHHLQNLPNNIKRLDIYDYPYLDELKKLYPHVKIC